MSEKKVIHCVTCKTPLKVAYDVVAFEGDSATFYFCMNKECPRYALASVDYMFLEEELEKGGKDGTKFE